MGDAKPKVMAEDNRELQRALEAVEVWNINCNNNYRGLSGRIVTQWPHGMSEDRARTPRPDDDAFVVQPR